MVHGPRLFLTTSPQQVDAAESAAEPARPGPVKQDKPAAAALRVADKKTADKKAAAPPKAQAGIASFFKKQTSAAPP
jgi:hypothetical protein